MNEFRVGDSWELVKQLEDESVDCVVTSPPYCGLRDYVLQHISEIFGVEGEK